MKTEGANSKTFPDSLSQCAQMLARRQVSACELAQQLLSLIKNRNRSIGAYVSLDAEYALQMAQAADQRRQNGENGPLLGIPLAVKDAIAVRNQPCTCCSRMLEKYQSPYDATVIARLRDAGMVFLGRTNMDEFAMGSSTETSAFQVTRNPWDKNCVPGGSSGGSAAAVGAGMAVAALGSDTGGSIRQPAAFCGCVGVKPSYGRVSRYGLMALAPSMDQIGLLVNNVYDAALLLKATAGSDGMDGTTSPEAVPDYPSLLDEHPNPITVGLPREYFSDELAPELQPILQEALRQYEQLGFKIREVSLPMTKYATAIYSVLAAAEGSTCLARLDGVRYGFRHENAKDPTSMYCKTRAAGFGAEVKRRILLGTYALSNTAYERLYLQAQRGRRLVCLDFEEVFKQCHVLLTPTTPTAAFPLGSLKDHPLAMGQGNLYAVPASLAGLCALSLPCGFTRNNLPVGLQIMAPAMRETLMLQVARAYERATAWGKYHPHY